jgi:putative hemolysin
VHTKLTVDQYLYCLGRGGLRGHSRLEAGVLRCSLPGHEAKGEGKTWLCSIRRGAEDAGRGRGHDGD